MAKLIRELDHPSFPLSLVLGVEGVRGECVCGGLYEPVRCELGGVEANGAGVAAGGDVEGVSDADIFSPADLLEGGL